MLVDFLKENHVAIATATLSWLWEATLPACCHFQKRSPHDVMRFMGELFVSTPPGVLRNLSCFPGRGVPEPEAQTVHPRP
jgi:hypothetical protein